MVTTEVFAADLLASPVTYQTGSYPYSITSGDFNGDKIIDLATANHDGRSVSILIGRGDGTFQTNTDFPIEGWPVSIAASDFNGDGKIDLATANVNWTVSVLIGNGDGTFQSGAYLSTNPVPWTITTGDFDGDGLIDLATANFNSRTVSVFIGNGDGTFQSRADYSTAGSPYSITPGDFNKDGNIDLATANWGTISILIGNGDGTFNTRVVYPGGYMSWDIVAADFNRDGNIDLATASGTLIIHFGNGDGTFMEKVEYSNSSGLISLFSISIGDFDGNGNTDIATISWESELGLYVPSILIGNGDGTFQAGITYVTPADGWQSLVVDDFNGDMKHDLATTNGLNNTISILLNSSNSEPIAKAGPDQVIECPGPSGTLTTLDASGSSDPDGDTLTYTWTWDGGLAEGVNPMVQLPLGTAVVTLTVSDGKATATDTVNITVRDTTPPLTTASGGNGDWHNTNIISTFSAYDSCSGVKEVHYVVNGHEMVVFGSHAAITLTDDGIYNISYFAVDNAGNIESSKTMTVKIDKTPPTVNLNTSPSILWPPDHKMTDVLIGGGATDVLSGLASVVFTVTDEYGTVQPSVNSFNTTIPLEAWRDGTDMDGRIYTVTATAIDVAGNKSTATTEVLVPHDQR